MSILRWMVTGALVAISSPLGIALDAAVAQTAIAIANPTVRAEIERAEALGREMYLYDQAAWHATDALLAQTDLSSVENPRGYVVVPRSGDARLDAVFLQSLDGELFEYARFTVDGSTVIGGSAFPSKRVEEGSLVSRLAAAREPALAAMRAAEVGLCSQSPPNSLTLSPRPDGMIPFFLLTSTTDPDIYPLGGHFRVDIGPDGAASPVRRYMNSCLDLPLTVESAPDTTEGKPGVSYLLGDVPSELHVFASFLFPDGLYVITPGNRRLWAVEKGRIALVQEDFGPT